MNAGPKLPPPAFSIQKAYAQHAAPIRKLVWASGINPTGLDWQRFMVALLPQGELIGCGQLKPHADGSMELASLAVAPAWRGRGVARALIELLLNAHAGHLYLMCQSSLGPLYEKFGFHAIRASEMPTYFRRVSKLAGVLENLSKAGEKLLVMQRPAAR
ncbi:MAG: GNAT family N-acetyltransferase [Anaerolineales bacterium]